MAKYIYSTMSADNRINIYEKTQEGTAVATKSVTIFGKANVVDKTTLLTPKGMLTTLEDEHYELIKDDYHFKNWVKGGFITVEDKQQDVEKVTKNMTNKDKSAQKKADDYKDLKAEIVTESK